MRLFRILVVAALITMFPGTASALCSYRGTLYAETSIEREFSDAKWVVRARVISRYDNWQQKGFSDNDALWSLYRLEIVQTYKGKLAKHFQFFTFRNSGGFYLDDGAAADIGNDYLLFLNQVVADKETPSSASGASEVNYSCGQSKPWSQVKTGQRQELSTLSRSL